MSSFSLSLYDQHHVNMEIKKLAYIAKTRNQYPIYKYWLLMMGMVENYCCRSEIIFYHSPNKRAVNICFIRLIHRFYSPYWTVKVLNSAAVTVSPSPGNRKNALTTVPRHVGMVRPYLLRILVPKGQTHGTKNARQTIE